LPELQNDYQPQNASSEAQQELYDLTTLMQEFNSLPNNVRLRYFEYDRDFEKYIIQTLDKNGIPKKETFNLINEIHDDIIPIVVQLKYHYHRIRPYQLAYYYNVPLYPHFSDTSFTPSYPSGHCIQAKVYCEVLGNRYPQFYNALMELAEDISKSRMYLGQHYKSDCEFGKKCAEAIIKHPEFKKKYKL
jgi:hypothetical protein